MASNTSILPTSAGDLTAKSEEKLFKGSPMTKRGAYAAVSYMTCAMLLVLFNKAALSSYNFPCADVITLFQMICSCFFLYVLRCWRLISFNINESPGLVDNHTLFVPVKKLIHTMPIAATYLLYMVVTMESVRGVNVPMYTTLRRTTVVFTMIIEFLLVQKSYPPPVLGSVGLIVVGAFVAGSRDLSFDVYGYVIVFLSNITTAIYLATISRIGKSSGLSTFGLMWCNGLSRLSLIFTFLRSTMIGYDRFFFLFVGIICLPILLLWTFIRGDLEMTINFPSLLSPGFLVVMFFSCILAFLLNYSIFLNTTLNSAVTQTICGNLKDLFTVSLGWIIFGGLPFDLLNVTGQLLGFFGSGLYCYYNIIGK